MTSTANLIDLDGDMMSWWYGLPEQQREAVARPLMALAAPPPPPKKGVLAFLSRLAFAAVLTNFVVGIFRPLMMVLLPAAREWAGCDPQPAAPTTWHEWVLGLTIRAVKPLLYRRTVHQSALQWLLQCDKEEWEFRTELLWILPLPLCYIGYRLLRRGSLRMKRRVDDLASSPEGIIPGSPLHERGPTPKGQVGVAIRKDGVLHLVGGGIRVENWLITPTHNTTTGCDLYVVNGDAESRVDTETEVLLAPDVSAFHLKEAAWTQLRVAQCKLGPLRDLATVTVTSACDQRFSVSTLRPTKPLGRVIYEGSTQPGFSGSAYANGSVVVGMHCHGGVRGGGYEMLYLYTRLKLHLDQPVEDSSEFFMREATKGFEYEDLGNEDVVVRLKDGYYHRTKKDVVSRMEQLDLNNWADETEYEELQDELSRFPETREPVMAFPGEGRRPASSAQALDQSAVCSRLQDLTSLVEKLARQQGSAQASPQSRENASKKRRGNPIQKSAQPSPKPRIRTAQPTFQRQQNGQAS